MRLHLPLLAVACFALTGCYAQRHPFRTTSAQRELLNAAPLPYTVAVRHWKRPSDNNPVAYTIMATRLLDSIRAFARVEYDSTGALTADLVAESTGDYCSDAVIPVFTLLTLGLFPTIWRETACNGVIFRSARNAGDSVVVRVQQSGTAVLGWLALPLMVLPGWSGAALQHSRGFRQEFRLAIIERQDDLARLAGR